MADVKPTVKGDAVDLKAYLFTKRTVKNEAGETVEKAGENGEIYENTSNALIDALKDAKEIKAEDGRLIGLETDDVVAEIRLVNLTQKVEGQKEGVKYAMEYVAYRAKTVLGAMVLAGGKDDQTFEKNDKGELVTNDEGEPKEVPSVTKYFNDGFKVLSNNAARARLTAILEGPDKALERAAENLAKAKGWSIEKARERIRIANAD